jgi:hypothetical protein
MCYKNKEFNNFPQTCHKHLLFHIKILAQSTWIKDHALSVVRDLQLHFTIYRIFCKNGGHQDLKVACYECLFSFLGYTRNSLLFITVFTAAEPLTENTKGAHVAALDRAAMEIITSYLTYLCGQSLIRAPQIINSCHKDVL